MQTGAARAVTALAASQHGAFAIRQAAARGITEKERRVRIARGDWEMSLPGVLTIAGTPKTWRHRLMVATLSCSGVISHRAAAQLHRLDGIWGEPLELTVRRPIRGDVPGFVIHHSRVLGPDDLIVVDGIPTTTVARTLCDLGAVVDDDIVEQALDDALRKGCSQRWIEETLARVDRPGKSGTGALRRVLALSDRVGRTPDSRFERLVERVIVSAGLPRPVRQHAVHDPSGRLLGRIDVAWPDIKLGIEATSERWHGALSQQRRDAKRDDAIESEGWQLLYPEWRDALAPRAFIAVVREMFRARQVLRELPA
jgi:hypothetical protein